MTDHGAALPLSQRIWRDALSADWSATTPWQGVRVAVGVVLAFTVGALLGSYPAGAAAAGGALAAGMSSIDAEGRVRLGRMTLTAMAMVVATFIGSASGDLTWLHVVLAALWACACGLLAAVEPTLTAIGVNSIIAFLVFGRFAASPGDALRAAGFVAAGSGVQVVLAAVLRRPARLRRETRLLAWAYAALADYAQTLPAGGNSRSAATAIDAAGQAIAASPVRGVARDAWEMLAATAARVRLQLLTLADARGHDAADRAAADQVTDAAATALRGISEALSSGRGGAGVGDAAPVFGAMTAAGDRHTDQVAAALDALTGQLRAAAATSRDAVLEQGRRDRLTAVPRSLNRRGRDGVEVLARVLANVSWRSAAMRHALRLAGAVLAATLVAHVVGLHRGYWIGVTAAIVLRPDFASTLTRGMARALGTVIGVGLASALAIIVHPEGVLLGVLVGVFAAAAASLFFASYMGFSVAITGAVVFLLATVDPSPVADAEERLVATVLGAAVALVTYRVWPTWAREHAVEALAVLCEAVGHYVAAVLATCTGRDDAERAHLTDLDRRHRLARTNAEASVDQSLTDPLRRQLDAQWAGALLSSLRRTALAAHALRARVESGSEWSAEPEVRRMGEALREELGAAAEALRTGHPPSAGRDRLRTLHHALVDAVGRRGHRDDASAWLLDQTDEMVDAVNGARDLLLQRGLGAR